MNIKVLQFVKNLALRGKTIKNFISKQKYVKSSTTEWKTGKEYQNKRKIYSYYNYGMYAAIFGACFGMVPVYRLFCEHVGLSGDFEQKDYSMKGKQINTHRKFTLKFKGDADPEVNWEFEPVQDEVIVNAGETALIFYRAYNSEPNPVIGFATYQIYPEDAALYFSKIQCFCFNQQLLNPKEELLLPLYFYLEPEISDDPNLQGKDEIRIIYKFIKCHKQDMLRFVQEELERVANNKKLLEEMRSNKKKNEEQQQFEGKNESAANQILKHSERKMKLNEKDHE